MFAGEEAAGVQVLHGLLADPAVEVVLVLADPPERAERRPLVHEAATVAGLATHPGDLVRDPEAADLFRRERIDLLLNVHSRHIVDAAVLGAPRIGSFNLHPGPLPEYAGLNVPSWAVYNGERRHGATVHWMDVGIDTGPIAYRESFELADRETGLSVAGKCVRTGVPLVLRLAAQAAADADAIPRVRQDVDRRRYFPAGPPDGGRLDWSRPAEEIDRFVRAADYGPFPSPWGHPTAVLGAREVGVVRVALTDARSGAEAGTLVHLDDDGALVATGDGVVVRVERVLVDGKHRHPSELM